MNGPGSGKLTSEKVQATKSKSTLARGRGLVVVVWIEGGGGGGGRRRMGGRKGVDIIPNPNSPAATSRGASGVTPIAVVAVENHWVETDAAGFPDAGERQSVTAKSQASGIKSSPWRIHTSAGRSMLARWRSLSESGRH